MWVHAIFITINCYTIHVFYLGSPQTYTVYLDWAVVSLVLVFQELEKKGDVKSDEENEEKGKKKEGEEEEEEEEIEGEYDEELEEVKDLTNNNILSTLNKS